jgi:hypothetical protein
MDQMGLKGLFGMVFGADALGRGKKSRAREAVKGLD